MVAIAGVGLLCSTLVTPVAPMTGRSVRANAWATLTEGLKRISRSPQLTVAVASLTFFDILAALTLMDVLLLARAELGMGDAAAGSLGAFAAIGTLIGALLCAYTSANRIAPIACLGIAATLCAVAAASHGYWSLGGLLLLLGIFGGLFVVPFIASVQTNAGAGEKGLIISTANVLDMAGALAASGLLGVLHDVIRPCPRPLLVIADRTP